MRWNDSDRRDTEARDACNDHRLETPLEDNTRVGTTETNPFLLAMTLRPAYQAPDQVPKPPSRQARITGPRTPPSEGGIKAFRGRYSSVWSPPRRSEFESTRPCSTVALRLIATVWFPYQWLCASRYVFFTRSNGRRFISACAHRYLRRTWKNIFEMKRYLRIGLSAFASLHR